MYDPTQPTKIIIQTGMWGEYNPPIVRLTRSKSAAYIRRLSWKIADQNTPCLVTIENAPAQWFGWRKRR